jgi:hypothetical protein
VLTVKQGVDMLFPATVTTPPPPASPSWSQVLTVNQVVDILVGWLAERDWGAVLQRVLPLRKVDGGGAGAAGGDQQQAAAAGAAQGETAEAEAAEAAGLAEAGGQLAGGGGPAGGEKRGAGAQQGAEGDGDASKKQCLQAG